VITREQNELLTRTGPGAAMGALLRRYWIPFLLAEELPAPDCPPVRVTLLSERLIAFRDSAGRIGLIDEFCAHRGVSLWFGRNEESGLRCAYHGWKYDTSGHCTDVPSDAAGVFCKRIRLKAYPCREGGGVVWTYLGPPDAMPAFPDFEWMAVPPSHRYVSKRWQESNYLQAMEGGIDGAHVSWLHRGALDHEPMRQGSRGAEYQRDTRPRIEVIESPAGITVGARRSAEAGSHYWRLTQWVMPWYNMIPPYGDHALHGHAWVPIDDENCCAWTFTHHPTRPLSAEEHAAMQSGEGIYATLIPGTYRPVAGKDNDYLIDRAAQKAGRYFSGVPGIAMQDASLQESPGPIADRSLEHLTATDTGIVMARNRLLRAVRAMEQREAPPALDPATHRVRAASFVRPADLAFKDVVEEVSGAAVRPGTAHITI
jgi:phthalate 4,5-dioxygenase oxygenase subunit